MLPPRKDCAQTRNQRRRLVEHQVVMSLAAAGFTGTSAQEGLIAFGLLSLSRAMLAVCPVMLWGLRGRAA